MKNNFATYVIMMSSVLAIPGGNLPKDGSVTALKSSEKTIIAEASQSPAVASILEEYQKLSLKAKYKDGIYKAQTPLDAEKYFTKVKLTIKKGKISAVSWTIYDAGHDNKAFNSEYYKVMEPYGDVYAQQAKDDWAGSRGYAKALIKSQSLDKVDAVSGATWTCDKFKEAVTLALKMAQKK